MSLFSGIGGLDLAAEWAGFETTAFCESDRFCRKVLEAHWPGVPCHPEIRDLDGSSYRGVALVTGGFPCQPFSLAGERRGEADDRFLWPEMLRVVTQARPAFVVAENVPGIVSLALDDVLASLEAEGYAARAVMVPARGVGALHKRERIFVVAADPARLRAAVPLAGGKDREDPHGPYRQAEARPSGRIEHLHPPLPDGGARRMAGRVGRAWPAEPRVGRVAHGVPRRVDRLKALGNAVVPQQAYPIMKAIFAEFQGRNFRTPAL